jgi:AraC-like DNA-binding protein
MAEITRQSLFESNTLQIGSFAARPVSDACGEVERQSRNAMVLPLSGVFAKHEAPGRYVVGTPSHVVFFASGVPYRIGFPGAVGDLAITLRFSEALASEHLDRHKTVGSHGLLPPAAMVLRNRLWARLGEPKIDRFEIEACSIDLVALSLSSLHTDVPRARPATAARWSRAVARVKEAVAVAPAEKWSVAELAQVAHLSPYHLCRVFSEATGTALYDYVLRERLARTIDAVLDGADLTGIALDAGFASHSHFTARFRAFFGCTPSTMRQGAKAGQTRKLRKIVTARPG